MDAGEHCVPAVPESMVAGRGPLVRPAVIPPDQAWFWTDEWLAGEAEADADIAAGRCEFFGSDEEFLAALDRAID